MRGGHPPAAKTDGGYGASTAAEAPDDSEGPIAPPNAGEGHTWSPEDTIWDVTTNSSFRGHCIILFHFSSVSLH